MKKILYSVVLSALIMAVIYYIFDHSIIRSFYAFLSVCVIAFLRDYFVKFYKDRKER
ncbi:TPA: hypothetical protein ACU26D_002742 [Staphylococcus aureus]|nr:hypothetical protein [Staphylococcus aureus]HDP6018784.1 hypothetical protein [Staphylococcus aureus]